jgi:hypothetical protein
MGNRLSARYRKRQRSHLLCQRERLRLLSPCDFLGGLTAVNRSSLTMRVGEMLDTLETVGGRDSRLLVRLERDAKIECIVGRWPSVFDSERARRLGLKQDDNFRSNCAAIYSRGRGG